MRTLKHFAVSKISTVEKYYFSESVCIRGSLAGIVTMAAEGSWTWLCMVNAYAAPLLISAQNERCCHSCEVDRSAHGENNPRSQICRMKVGIMESGKSDLTSDLAHPMAATIRNAARFRSFVE